jgi:hypothetical protein
MDEKVFQLPSGKNFSYDDLGVSLVKSRLERLQRAEEFLYPDNVYLKGVFDSASLLEKNFGFNTNWRLQPWPGGCQVEGGDGEVRNLTRWDTRCAKNRIPIVLKS